jgi:hypothetical protein
MFQITPERNQQLPRQRHNADAPHALAATGEAFLKPAA